MSKQARIVNAHGQQARITYHRDTEEFRVQIRKQGNWCQESEYFTDCSDDAEINAQYMLEHHAEQVKRQQAEQNQRQPV